MIGKIIVGAVVVGAGYLAYKKFVAPSTSSSSTASGDGLTALQREQAAWLAQKYIPGYAAETDSAGLGGCMGCLGAARGVQIL